MEMLSRIHENSNSSQEVKLQDSKVFRKKNPQTVDTDNEPFNCDNADGHSLTGIQKMSASKILNQ